MVQLETLLLLPDSAEPARRCWERAPSAIDPAASAPPAPRPGLPAPGALRPLAVPPPRSWLCKQ